MLLAYALSAEGQLTDATIDALRALETRLAAGYVHDLGLQWEGVAAGPVEGVFVRGATRATSRAWALRTIDALQQLSREFPGITIHLSGWGDLPPTTLRAGAFELFTEPYARALASGRHRHAS